MSDDPYKAPEVGSEVSETTEPRPPFIDSQVLWIVFGLFGGIPILAAFLDDGSGTVLSRSVHFINEKRLAIGSSTILID